MRPKATRRGDWVQLGIGAAALLLPPLALGAAFYSMLAAPDEEVTRPAVAGALAPPPAAYPAEGGTEPAAFQPPVAKLTEGPTPPPETRAWERLPGQDIPPQTGPIQVAVTSAAAVSPPADAVNGGGAPPAAESQPPAPAPKRNVHRHAPRPQQDPYPVRTWLQQIGILPRNSKDIRD
jgi:hypothetical protein